MGLNATPSANRIHIGFFGKRNAGKSSVVNAVTGQDLAIVSETKGTTTDPVLKAMELLPLGPVVIIDTPGLDDEGDLGTLRVKKAWQMLNRTDVAVLVVDASHGRDKEDDELIARFAEKSIPYIVALNKCDLLDGAAPALRDDEMLISALERTHITELKEKIAALASSEEPRQRLVADLIDPLDLVVLVVPIDKAAPKGRLILPQQQVIRDILDAGAIAVISQDRELPETLKSLGKKPRMVITDSQAFEKVAACTPRDIPLTSFSILFARRNGLLDTAVAGARTLGQIENGDRVLISEGCTHHRQCEDIGTVKLPRWIRNHTGKEPSFEFTSGGEFPENLQQYKLIVHCGGCMLNPREMASRRKRAEEQGVPMTNYGILIAFMKGILERSLEVFGM